MIELLTESISTIDSAIIQATQEMMTKSNQPESITIMLTGFLNQVNSMMKESLDETMMIQKELPDKMDANFMFAMEKLLNVLQGTSAKIEAIKLMQQLEKQNYNYRISPYIVRGQYTKKVFLEAHCG